MSEFGKGLGYCLGLFLCHAERKELYDDKVCKALNLSKEEAEIKNASMWFYAATDHLYDMEIPEKWIIKSEIYEWINKFSFTWFKKYYCIVERLNKFRGVCFDNRLTISKINPKVVKLRGWAIQEAKDLLMEIDRLNGIDVEKGDFE